jgi:hypothetical protein
MRRAFGAGFMTAIETAALGGRKRRADGFAGPPAIG